MAGLTDRACATAKPLDKAYRLKPAERGMHLFITPAGGKFWRYRYAFKGAERLLSLGRYPDVSLADARTARDKAKAEVRSGKDPYASRLLEKTVAETQSSETFEPIAREWHGKQSPTWTENHSDGVLDSLERFIFPTIGTLPIRAITAPIVLDLIRVIENRPAVETARRVRQRVSAIFQYAIASGKAETDPASMIKKAMAPVERNKQPALTDLGEAREMLRKVEAEFAHPVTKLANRFLALTAVRPGALRKTTWEEIGTLDADSPIWKIPAARMKLKKGQKKNAAKDHYVPLSRQAVEILEALRAITANSPYVFPNTRSILKPMSESTISAILNRAGYKDVHCPHGWRSTFSTVMNERYRSDSAVIDLMLAHIPEGKVEAAYNRSIHIERRRELSQLWADIILKDAVPVDKLLNGPMR